MFSVYKLRDDHVLDFAAEELKKYLLMMMPEVGIVNIQTDPGAKEGFRLGLLEDFGLEAGDIDPVLDDVVHIETTEEGGVLAGSNPRSVLFAVYRFLKLNGCRFLFPGAEGERIPLKKITPQKYHHLADHPFRGRTIEGTPSLEQILVALDFYAKEELNAFGCYAVANYSLGFYTHQENQKHWEPEFFDYDLAEVQWRALFEAEAKKRGMMLLTGEHEMIPNALGLNGKDRRAYRYEGKPIPQEIIPWLAEINGVRTFFRGDMFYTNLCMSKPEVRERMAQVVVEDVCRKPQADVYGAIMADLQNNHCECAACREKIPSDWYVMVLNRIDELLTEKGIKTRILFSFYVETIFAPEVEKFNNPDRFLFQYCPISRTYTSSLNENSVYPEPLKYVRNNWDAPKDQEMLISMFRQWKRIYNGPCTAYEYHFWRHQYRDPGMQAMSRRIYEDVRAYRIVGLDGCMQDGSMKSYWPNAFHNHIYNETMVNRDVDYEKELADFYESLYGKDWQKAQAYLQEISDAFDHVYMCGEKSADPDRGAHYNPAQVEKLSKVAGIAEKFQEVLKNVEPTHRVEYQGWKLLRYHAMYCTGLAKVLMHTCQGDVPGAMAEMDAFCDEFGKYEMMLDRWFDYQLATSSTRAIIKKMPKVEF